jgi:hypothetical protein
MEIADILTTPTTRTTMSIVKDIEPANCSQSDEVGFISFPRDSLNRHQIQDVIPPGSSVTQNYGDPFASQAGKAAACLGSQE